VAALTRNMSALACAVTGICQTKLKLIGSAFNNLRGAKIILNGRNIIKPVDVRGNKEMLRQIHLSVT
jgi:hypothetical protein